MYFNAAYLARQSSGEKFFFFAKTCRFHQTAKVSLRVQPKNEVPSVESERTKVWRQSNGGIAGASNGLISHIGRVMIRAMRIVRISG